MLLFRVAAVKRLLVSNIFGPFGIIEFIYSHFENRVLLKLMLKGRVQCCTLKCLSIGTPKLIFNLSQMEN